MRPRCCSLALAVVVCLGAAPAAAQNLIQNGTFDTGVAPWTGFISSPGFVPDDALGLPSSGSMQGFIAHPSGNAAELLASECVSVTAGTAYLHRYDYRLQVTAGVTGIVTTKIIWFGDPTCSPASGLFSNSGFPGEIADDAWHPSPDPDREFIAPPGAQGARLELVVAKISPGGAAVARFDNVAFKALGTCAGLSHVLCLNQDRFQVEARWRTPSAAGRAAVVKLTDDTGYLWFFGPDNVEVVIKVLDACAPFGTFWVFAGGLTDVGVDITVTDTKTGEQKEYASLLGVPFAPVQDTAAFDTCP